MVVRGLSCEWPLVFGRGSVEVKPIFGEKKKSSAKKERVKDLKDTNPIELAEYARANNIA